MTFGLITVNRPGAAATIGIMGPIGKTGEDGQDAVGIQGPPVFSPIAAWVSGLTYQPGSATAPASFVSYNGSSYACTTLHTSGSFAADLAAGLWEPVSLSVQGMPGADGATWYAGAGLPSTLVGVTNDFFFWTDTADIFQKLSGTWTLIANIKGSAGSTIQSGTGAPAASLGNNGDFYLDLTSSAPRLFGPKANGAWPASGISLIAGSGTMNPTGSFTVGHVLVAATADGQTVQDGGALGDAAFKNTGTAAGTLAAGNDARITGAASATALSAEATARAAQFAFALCFGVAF